MSNVSGISNSWPVVKLADITTAIQYGYTTSASDKPVGPRFLRITDIQNNNVDWNAVPFCKVEAKDKSKYLLEQGDIVFARTGATVGKSFLIKEKIPETIYASYLIRVRLKPEIEARYIDYFFKSSQYWKQISASQAGIGQPNVNGTKLAQLQIPLAPPEQQRLIIAEIEKQFSRLDEAVANLKRVKANLKRYKAAVLKAAVEGKLTEEWRKKRPDIEPASKLLKLILSERRAQWEKAYPKKKFWEPKEPTTDILPPLPKTWTWATLPQLGELNRGKSKHRPRNDPKLYGGPYPFIQTGDVRHASRIITQYEQTYSDAGLTQSRLWPKGTLCITIAANIADTAILGFDACFPDSIVGFIPESKYVDVKYAEYFLRTAKENIERFAPATAQKNINLEILYDVAVPLPPLMEQRAIIDEIERRLSVADDVEKAEGSNTARAERLRQAILRQAFEGRL